jgi:Domain of unknown function (DUF5668)/Cell wall-active antibiotics response 4TMS YvqF
MALRSEYGPRSGAIVAAVWLIGLGVVFLLQQTLDWSWGEAWPLFLILAGVGSITSVFITVRPVGRWMVALTWPLALIVVGSIFLLSTTGRLGTDLGEIVRWWPVALIVLGAWYLIVAFMPRAVTAAGSDRLVIPLEGATSASVRLQFGGGEVTVEPGPADQLLVGEFENGAAVQRRRGPGSVELSPDGATVFPWFDRPLRWRVGVTTGAPLDLDLQCGAAKVRVDLTGVALRRLKIQTGASDTRVLLPRAAGESFVKAEGGAASLTFEVPAGVAARIKSQMVIGSTSVDESRFPKTASGRWESPDYASAANRVELEVSGGVGSVRVAGVA